MSSSSVTPWTIACQAPLSIGFPKQEFWSGLPYPSLGDPSDPKTEPMSSALASGFFTTEPSVIIMVLGKVIFSFHHFFYICWLSFHLWGRAFPCVLFLGIYLSIHLYICAHWWIFTSLVGYDLSLSLLIL